MKYALWLANVPGIAGMKIQRLLELAGSAEAVYGMDGAVLSEAGIAERDITSILNSRLEWNLDEQMGILAEKGISIVSREQEAYPDKLRNIYNPPYLLYYKGTLPDSKQCAAAIVGARGRSEYGRQVARHLAEALAYRGVCVVSGLARGIDADGHAGALAAAGKTYAVLGCGVDICYPKANQYLYDRILDSGGGILSEYPVGQQPLARLFPSRNRIISGLSDYVVIVEARKKSGSLITADYALEQGKEVYTVPGRIADSLSSGCNRLIAQGAGIICDIDEFVSGVSGSKQNFSVPLNFQKNLLEKDEWMVYSLLDFCPTGLGTLVEKSDLPLGELLGILGRLEEKGFVYEAIPNYYVRNI